MIVTTIKISFEEGNKQEFEEAAWICLCAEQNPITYSLREMGMNCGGVVVRFGLWVVAMCIAGYIVAPPLYWHLIELLNHSSVSSSSSSCAPCVCDCSSQPIITIPQGNFTTFSINSPFYPFWVSVQNLINSLFPQNNYCFHQAMCFHFRSASMLLFVCLFIYCCYYHKTSFSNSWMLYHVTVWGYSFP